MSWPRKEVWMICWVHVQSHHQKTSACPECNETFPQEDSLRNHKLSHVGFELFECKECVLKFNQKVELMNHEKGHIQPESLECGQCDKSFSDNKKLVEHAQSHRPDTVQVEYKCTKCEKIYKDMRKLRRHDWRSHRSIECTICSEMLGSREDITSHRQSKHLMFRRISCKFFPDCYDEDECLFEHNLNEQSRLTVCPKGKDCSDQSCSFSEKNHRSQNPILCRFQEKCNRSACPFKHTAVRKSFLGLSPLKARRI